MIRSLILTQKPVCSIAEKGNVKVIKEIKIADQIGVAPGEPISVFFVNQKTPL